MKILGYLPPLGVGGGSITMQALLEELARRGHEVKITIDWKASRGSPQKGHKLIQNSLKGIDIVSEDFKWADVVFTQLMATQRGMQLARSYRKPVVTYIHDRNRFQVYGITRRNVALVIFNSEWLQKESNFRGNQIVVNPPIFAEDYRTERGDGILLVALIEKKGVHLYYELARRLPDHHFIALKGRGDSILSDLPNVETLESVPPDRMKEVYSKARLVLMPSREVKGSTWIESWGRVGIEAAASGIPCLASLESPGLRESLGGGGIFLPCKDVDAWEKKIRELDDPKVYQMHSEYALKLSAKHDPKPQIDALEVKLAGLFKPVKNQRIDFFATQRHFIDHLEPIYHALPDEYKGDFIVEKDLLSHAKKLGIKAVTLGYYQFHRRNSGPLVIASIGSTAKLFSRSRPIVLVNHGAGQSWQGVRHPSYAGGPKRNIVSLFIEPGEDPAQKDAQAYPKAKVVVAGCCKLDEWHKAPPKPRSNPPVIAVSFHWHCRVVPETRSTLPYYRYILADLARWEKSGEVKILGHGHPSPAFWKEISAIWKELDIEIVADFKEVMQRADVFVNDGMSTLYEFASLDRPVVVLNAPWYRKNVEHGLRFWECADVGIQVDKPEDLIPAIKEALLDRPEQRLKRQKAVQKVYKYTDGRATERAVKSILELLK